MPLEQQVTSLDWSQKLEAVGVKKESYFAWYLLPTKDNKGEVAISKLGRNTATLRQYANDWFRAYTVAELGEMLGTVSEGNLIKAYGHVFNVPDTRFITATGLQDCMSRPDVGAKMLAYLIENNLIVL